MDYMPQSLAAHEYAERLNAALARLGLTDRLTLPPAPNTAIDELPAVVDVPLRKTLSVLMGKAQQGDASALATLEWTAQVAESIFAGLHARDFAGDRPLALPSHESLATLSQGVDALLPRKISNGAWSLLADGTPSDGIDDGMSLVRLLCSSAASSVTELKDDNEGWVMTKNVPNNFPAIDKLVLGCAYVLNFPNDQYLPTTLREIEFPNLISWGISSEYRPLFIYNNPNITELTFPKCKAIGNGFTYADTPKTGCFISSCENLRVVRFPELYKYGAPEAGFGASYEDNYGTLVYGCNNLEELYLPKWTGYRSWRIVQHCPALKKLVLGTISTGVPSLYNSTAYPFSHCTNLVHLEIQGCVVSLDLRSWNPTSVLSDSERLPIFLSNFKTYIAERLSEQGSGKTLTLSQAVRDAIEGDPTIAQIITSKGWTISPAPTA